MGGKHTFRLSVLGRYPARLAGNESHVTANLIAGADRHMIYCGTLTMSDAQWATFTRALRDGLGDAFEVVEGHEPTRTGDASHPGPG